MNPLKTKLLDSPLTGFADRIQHLAKKSRNASPSTRAKVKNDWAILTKELEHVYVKGSQDNLFKSRLLQTCKQETAKVSRVPTEAAPSPIVTVDSYDDRELAFQAEIFEERNSEINEIELQLASVKELMYETATTVHSQGADLDRLDYFVDNTSDHVKRSVKELNKAAELQTTNSRCACRTMLIWVAVLCCAFALVQFLIKVEQ